MFGVLRLFGTILLFVRIYLLHGVPLCRRRYVRFSAGTDQDFLGLDRRQTSTPVLLLQFGKRCLLVRDDLA